ncbi:glycosyltransferase [Xenococcus sp. PCC 7305]|uniref:glycosyltransferase family 4 protein n=1 Tax=Xenococcus sp. PCC 7305 TaxID=102125 RepID=UPI0002AC0592|nr:glycosyltransferase family 4 protein [Xenococcus sp. PCC 7305]ELS04093.1 glycosyltransferase [Xenococcus sp. PCC 7305]
MNSRILFYSDNPPIGGVPQYNHSMLCKLATSGYDVISVQIEQSNHRMELEKELGIRQIWLDQEQISGYAASYKDLDTPREIISSVEPDLIFFSDGWPLGNFAAKQIAVDMGIPYIIVVGYVDTACSKVVLDDGIPYTEIASYHYNCAESVSAVSQENLDLLHKLFNVSSEHSGVVHYGRPKHFFTPRNAFFRQRLCQETEIPEDGVICFTAARMARVKGFEYQLEAIASLKELPVWEKLYFVWAGKGIKGEDNTTELKQKITDLGVANKVKFLGERQDIPDLLGAVDIFVLPSKAEGMPICVIEAMAKGLPVVASAVSGIPEELGKTGKLLPDPNFYPQDTINELAATLEAWAFDDELRKSMGKACQERAKKMFTEERMHQDYFNIIDKILKLNKQKDKNLILSKGFSLEQINDLNRKFYYGYSVWKAWHSYRHSDLSLMVQFLEQSQTHTPLLKVETILNWIENFVKYSREKGEQLNTYDLVSSKEWENLLIKI